MCPHSDVLSRLPSMACSDSCLFLLFIIALNFITLGNAITEPSDAYSLAQFKAAIDPKTVKPGSCISTWNFAMDPCDNLFGAELFSCGIECAMAGGGIQRITSVKLDSSSYGGVLSPALGNLSALQHLQVAGNELGGTIPVTIGQLNQLIILDLSNNAFTGTLPDSLRLLASLESLNVAGNSLSGALPSLLSAIANLLELRMQRNFFTGPLPDLSPLKQLQVVDLSNNALSGRIPLSWPTSLISISVRNNGLTGDLTKDYVNGLSATLNVLDLSGNRLSGSIDASLFQHPSLQQINLSNNSFDRIVNGQDNSHGGIIRSSMIAIDISNNQIGGMLPHMFAHMQGLSSLSLSHNAFTGRIHMSYAVKAVAGSMGLVPLERLMLDGNYLAGPLPPLFMKLLPGSITASFVDNCLSSCPPRFFFCQGGVQKPSVVCRRFNTMA